MASRHVLSVGLMLAARALAFDPNSSNNLAVYWGQNSYGAAHSDSANWQQRLSVYCQDDTIDIIPISSVTVAFSTGNVPSINLANICNINDDPVFAGTQMPDCTFLAPDIKGCQAAGKALTMSLGGASGGVVLSSNDQAETFAQSIWDNFLGGTSTTRPFGDAVLDGIDLDIEGGSPLYWDVFITKLRSLAAGDSSKSYYVTAAPQCPFPDAWLGTALNAVAFDAVYVQFYNNGGCNVDQYSGGGFTFSQWDNWAKTTSPNPNVKIFIGAPASSSAANNGYVDAAALGSIVEATRSQYSSFGGVMLWDASQAYANNRYDKAIKAYLPNGGTVATTTKQSTSTSKAASTSTAVATTTTTKAVTSITTSSAPAATTTAASGSCGLVAGWVANIAYTAGDQVTYAGFLWTAKQWTYADTPGGAAGSWTQDGPCASTKATRIHPSLTTIPVASMTGAGGVVQPSSASKRSMLFKREQF
ncbi:carbohydrate-binding module family 5 protein [Peniophora sp. CONT]|nr:carbohydrate-binding module family 5 protein [Peniophora sp. CONT]